MKSTQIRHKVIMSALAGMIIVPGSAISVMAAEDTSDQQSVMPVAGIESVLNEGYNNDVKENINLYMVSAQEGEYLNIAFADTEDYIYIRSNPDEDSEWTGKLYKDSAAEVLEYLDGWTKIRSGNAEGYVPADSLYTGEEARAHAGDYEKSTATVTADVLNVRDGQGTDAEILTQIQQGEEYTVTGEPVDGWYPVTTDTTDGWVSGKYVDVETSYSYGETKEEEADRIAAEKAAEEAAKEEERKEQEAKEAAVQAASTGQAVIDYACQFIGNPYVWGGTSLTDGADCSGFVQSVYANFGISLPRTSYEQRSAGYEVSYDEAQPGDLILYDGHVGLYMGDGNIVNAMDEEHGIGICSATYTNILAVRRVL